MEVNQEIWGAPSTWRRDTDGFSSNSNVPDELQFKRGEYNDIGNYVSNNRLTQGEPIDYSICYGGQAENMPLASIRTWNSVYTGGQWVATSYKRNVQTGWFFGHHHDGIDSSTSQLTCSNAIFKNDGTGLTEIKSRYWTPNGTAGSYPNQPSQRIIPIVSFPPRGCYFGIYCRIFNPSNGQTQYKYLDELKAGDWSAWKIIRAYGQLYTYRTSDADFAGVPTGSSHYCCVSINTPLEFEEINGDEKALAVLSYATLCRETIPIFGWISNEWSIARVNGVYHCMSRVFNSTTQTSSYAPIFIDSVPNAIFNVVSYDSWGQGFEGYCDITAENLEAIRKAAAAYGLFFTEKDPTTLRTNTSRWTHTDMFCGLLDNNGIGHGEYTQGTGNRDNPAYNMGTSENSNYNPITPPAPVDPNTYSNISNFKNVVGVYTGAKQYVVSALAIDALTDSLFTIVGNWTGVSYAEIMGKVAADFLVSNPLDSIVSLQAFPFTPTMSSESTTVVLGKYDTNVSAHILSRQLETINFSGVPVFARFGGCYLDYEPYTSYEIYVPFCGTVTLKAADILGHTLNVKLIVDMYTGVCTGYILADSLCIETVTGTCGVQLPIAGLDTATINANIVNANLKYKSAVSNETAAVMSPLTPTGFTNAIMNPVQMGNTVTQAQLNVSQAEYEIKHIQAPPHMIGAASPLTGWCMDTNARLIIYYPTGDIITNETPPSFNETALAAFGELNGFSCLKCGKVSEFSGYTVGNVKLNNVPCTESERARLKQLFATGVYL